MLVNLNDIMKKAIDENRIIPGFNVFGYEDAKMVIEVAESLNAPVILMTNRDAANFMDVKYYGALYGKMAHESSAPICIHLDHGKTKSEIVAAIQANYSSVMYDGSSLPLEDNIKISKEISEFCRACNVSFEVEVGCVAYSNPDIKVDEKLTEPKEVLKMYEEADVDCVAVAVGNVHRMEEKNGIIDFERLSEIKNLNSVPLVIHGSTGISDEQLIKMRYYGIGKMNIGTAVRMAFGNTLRDFLKDNPNTFDRIELVQRPMEEMRKVIEEKYKLLGWG
ncbi:class II fructose-bisphosphate aldolase [Ilyobacter polytropus]|uniref:Tagatose-bisphosphate aldolase n=1 Tax=Ilyobacter polytropus (strain ATCC 51220 / DSM 2926 / LMG 16218 / CuHBu1) TaxID=572544 RepID=E3HC39_ILYPC|nr:class II fructose-bisphosphate aldolase [Ilyobacter polytropus]ADO83882.1 Tagatose-bisphosphate aldolase [Ilyobacter polytropus DSM 2926]